eukprot:7175490-Prymnesium_polylepis.1
MRCRAIRTRGAPCAALRTRAAPGGTGRTIALEPPDVGRVARRERRDKLESIRRQIERARRVGRD